MFCPRYKLINEKETGKCQHYTFSKHKKYIKMSKVTPQQVSWAEMHYT